MIARDLVASAQLRRGEAETLLATVLGVDRAWLFAHGDEVVAKAAIDVPHLLLDLALDVPRAPAGEHDPHFPRHVFVATGCHSSLSTGPTTEMSRSGESSPTCFASSRNASSFGPYGMYLSNLSAAITCDKNGCAAPSHCTMPLSCARGCSSCRCPPGWF